MIKSNSSRRHRTTIELGRASRETKGNTNIPALDDVSGAFKSQPGLTAD